MDNRPSAKAKASETAASQSLVEMNRLNNLSDGVFAIALTLLAFDIRLPDGILVGELPSKLLDLVPKFIVYLISFVVIGGAWGAHQRMLKQIRRGDGLLVWFNLACLLFVGLVPAAAAILGRYPSAFIAITCFALDVALIQLSTLWLWRHADRQALIDPGLDPRVIASIGRRLSLSTIIFVLSILPAYWNALITYLFWVGLFILLFTTDWLSWQQAARRQQTRFPLDDVKRAVIHIQHEVGQLQVDSKAQGSTLLDGSFGGGLVSSMERSKGAANIQLRGPERQGLLSYQYPWSWGPENAFDWNLHLSDRIPLALEIKTSTSMGTYELGALQITDLKISAKGSTVQVFLPDREGTLTVNIDARGTMLVLHIPPDAAAYIHDEKGTGTVKIDPARFPAITEGREFRSKRYKTASKRVDIRIDSSGSAVEIV